MPEHLKNFWLWTIEEAVKEELWWYGWALLVLLLVILWISKRIKKDLVSIFSDEDGNVKITPHALQEIVSKSCLDMEGIYSPTTTIHRRGDEIRLLVRIQVSTDSNIQEARKKLKAKLEQIMIENLCFSNFGGVDLIIKGFKNKD